MEADFSFGVGSRSRQSSTAAFAAAAALAPVKISPPLSSVKGFFPFFSQAGRGGIYL